MQVHAHRPAPVHATGRILAIAMAGCLCVAATFGAMSAASKFVTARSYQTRTVADTFAPSGDAHAAYGHASPDGSLKLAPISPRAVAGH